MSKITMKLKVGVVGCGSISEFRHFPEYRQRSDVELVSCYDETPARAAKMATQFGLRATESLDALLADKSLDAVSVCSPNHLHASVTLAALAKGKHVLCEKPMALTLDDCRAMIAAAEKAGKVLMIGHNQRLAPAHVRARELLASGELGRVISFRTTFGHRGPEYWSVNRSNTTWFFNKASSGFGVVGDLAIHKIDLLRYLLDDEIAEVQANSFVGDKKNPDGTPIEVPDNVVSVLRTLGGACGTLTASWTYYGPEDNSTTLYCEKGTITIFQDPLYPLKVSKPGGEEVLYKLASMATNDRPATSGVIDAFVECILHSKPAPVTGFDGLRGLEVILALLESSTTGNRVTVGKV